MNETDLQPMPQKQIPEVEGQAANAGPQDRAGKQKPDKSVVFPEFVSLANERNIHE